MVEKINAIPESIRLKGYSIAMAAAWTLVMSLFLGWIYYHEGEAAHFGALAEVRASFSKDLLYRRWVAGHGGVYVPVTGETPPNPYLEHIDDRDVLTISGTRLTLINPAYMTRQVHELAQEQGGSRGHLTSLKPIRPENAPDPWEAQALAAFEEGKKEVYSIEQVDGEPNMRLMQPLFVEERCMKCHSSQGYQPGDIRGGLSVSAPMEPYLALSRKEMVRIFLAASVIWLVGLAGIALGTARLGRKVEEGEQFQEALRESQARFRAISEGSFEGICISETGKIVDMNPQYALMLGYEMNELVGVKITDLVPVELRHNVQESIKNEGEEAYESRNIRKDGTIIDVKVQARHTTYQGRSVRITAVRNITQRKLAEEKLRTSLAEKEVLLKEVRHRVKTNLQGVMGLMDFQATMISDGDALRAFKETGNRVLSMSLIQELLHEMDELSRIDFSEFVGRLSQHLSDSYSAASKRVCIDLDLDGTKLNVDTAIPCGLIINELLSNSLEHAFPEDGEGEIRVLLHKNGSGGFELTVQDDGIGLPEGRNGMGLILVESLVDQLSGIMEVERNGGTAFRISFEEYFEAGIELY
jgi:PAS domain S-box-containing protein